jgi:hypothetical protein
MKWLKEILSEAGYASSTRLVKVLIVLIFCGDWIYTRLVEKVQYTPPIEVLGFVATILGLSLAQKYLETKKPS